MPNLPKKNPATVTQANTVKKEEKIKELHSIKLLNQLALSADNAIFDSSIKGRNHKPSSEEQTVLENFSTLEEEKLAVLGIDIYKYSQFPPHKQKIIPSLFFFLKFLTENCFSNSESLFSYHYDVENLKNDFIHTGDGGSLFFKNPLEATIFLQLFNIAVHLFNSHHLFPGIRNYLDEPITLRYTITFDTLYKIDHKFFGPAIIHNARIISKDKLNRFLIDNNTYEWFLDNTNGIENLPNIYRKDLSHLEISNTEKPLKTTFFNSTSISKIRNVFCQKLEKITVKDDHFEVYNIMIQSLGSFFQRNDIENAITVITTVGNMNCNGI